MSGERTDRGAAQPAPGKATSPAGATTTAGKQSRSSALYPAEAGPGATREPSSAAAPSLPAWSYVEQSRALMLGAIAERIQQVGLSQPHARLPWGDPKAACAAVDAAIRNYVDAAPGMALKRLMQLAFPADLIGVVDQARNGRQGSLWLPEIGRALGEAFDTPLVASVQRMGLRLRVQLDGDAHGAMPRGSSLVASCALDGVIADVLVAPGMVKNQPAKAARDIADKPFAHGAHEVEYKWIGDRDPSLWNWICVTSPEHATAEDVARTPLAGGEIAAGSEQAHRIAASPPYFAIPIETARLVKAATDFAPPEVKSQLAKGDLGPRVASGAALAGSALADEAALMQASALPAAASTAPVGEHALERAEIQCRYLVQRLAPWRAQSLLAGVQTFLQRRLRELGDAGPVAAGGAANAGLKPATQQWAPVLVELEHTLRAASSEVKPLLDELERHAMKPQDAASAPVLQTVRAYAHAAGVAHLTAEAPAALAEARRLRAMLPIALAEDRIRIARSAVADQQMVQRGAGRVEDRSREPIAAVPGLATRAADLRLQSARGEGVDGEAADELAADADTTALRAEIAAFETELATVERLANAADVSVDNGGGWTIQRVTTMLRGEAASWLSELDRTHDPHRIEGANDRHSRTAGARRTIDSVRRQKLNLMAKTELDDFLKYAYRQIADQELRNALNRMALQIGLMIVTGEIAGAAVAAVRGIALAREARLVGEVIADIRKMQIGYQVLETTGQAYLMTKAQGATGGPTGAGAFAENLAGLALSSAAMQPFEALLGDTQGVERELRTWLDRAMAGARTTVHSSLELGTGMAAAGAANTLVHGRAPRAAGADDLISQGIALVATKLVHRHTGEMRDRITRAMANVDRGKAQALLARIGELSARSEASSTSLQPADEHLLLGQAREQLAESGELLGQEAELYQHASGKPAESARAGNAAARAERTGALLEAPLRLAGLTPVVDGAIFEGTPAQISAALADARRAGIPLQTVQDPRTGVWHVSSGDHHVELHALGAPKLPDAGVAPGSSRVKDVSAAHDTGKATEGAPAVARDADPDERVVPQSAKPASKRGRGLPEYPIAKSTIKYEIVEKGGQQLECEYVGKALNGQAVQFGDVHMPMGPDGMPAGPPEANIGMLASVYIGGKEHVPRIYDQVIDSGRAVPLPSGELTATTRYVLDSFAEFYERRFGTRLNEWSGSLAFTNKLNFQRVYTKLRLAKVTEPLLSVEAIKAISFGIHRAEAGFTELTVESSDIRLVNLGDDLGVQPVPTLIKIHARRP